jgi:imidazolonepropionase-like amidohydrolase
MKNSVGLAALSAAVLLSGAAQAETTVFKNFTLIDGTGRKPVADAALVVSDGHIQAVGRAAEVKTPAGAKVVDLGGKYVIPGLIDNHVHVALVNGLKQDIKYYTRQNVESQLRTYAAYGVTAVQVLGTDKDLIFDVIHDQRAHEPDMARVFSVGRGVVFQGSYGGVAGLPASVATPEQARAMVDKQAANGADMIKFWMDDELGTIKVRMPYTISKAVIDEAHKHHLKVLAHVFYLANAKELVREGVDGFAHEVRDQPVDDALVSAMKARPTSQYAATLSREASFTYSRLPFLNDPFFTRGVTPDVVDELKSPAHQQKLANGPEFKRYGPIFNYAMANFHKEEAGGVRYGMGTDSGPSGRFPGYFAHWEMQLMAKAGLTPMQVLVAATHDNAELIGAKDLGTLEPHKQADMVVLDKDPTADIAATRTIRAVYVAGKSVPTIWNTCAGRAANACSGGPETAPVLTGGMK